MATTRSAPAAPQLAARASRFRYDAFLSYSHAVDGRLAPALQRGLHRFAKPWNRRRALHAFRDETDLTATGLWPAVARAIEGARWFVLLASPEAAASSWVNREIEHWFATRGGPEGQQVLVVLTRDDAQFVWETSRAIPPALRARLEAEPRVVDVRWARDAVDVSLDNVRFRDAVADVALPIHGYAEKADLYGEDAEQHRRTRRIVRGAVMVLALLFVAALAAAVVALDQRREARAERNRAEAEARTALSRQLAAQSLNAITDNDLDLARLLALEAYRTEPTVDARSSLVSALQASGRALGVVVGPRTSISRFAFSPDGATIATGGQDGSLRLWDARTSAPRRTLVATSDAMKDFLAGGELDESTFDSAIASVAFSGDGRVLAAGRYDGRILLFDVKRQRRLQAIPGKRSVASIALNGDGRTLAVAADGRSVRLWDTARRQPLPRTRQPRGVVLAGSSDLEGPIEPTLRFGPDSQSLAWRGRDGIVVWDVHAGRARGGIGFGEREALRSTGAFAFVLGGRMLAVPTDGGVGLWDVNPVTRGGKLGTISVNEVAANLRGNVLAELRSSLLVVRDLPSRRIRAQIPVDGLTDRNVAVSPDGRTVAHLDLDAAAVRLWSTTPTRRHAVRLRARVVSNVAFGAGGRMLALSRDGAITDPAHGPLGPPIGIAGPTDRLAISPGGKLLLTSQWIRGTPRSRIELRDLSGRKRHARAIPQAADQLLFDRGGRALALTANGVWDLARGKRVGSASGAALAPDGDVIVGQSLDQLILRDVETGKQIKAVNRLDYSPGQPVFSPDGTILATVGAFGITLRSVPDLRVLATTTRAVGSPLAFSAESRLLAASTRGGSVRLFDARTGRAVGNVLRGFGRSLAELTYGPDGRLVAVDETGRIVVWDSLLATTGIERWRARLCGLTAFNLSQSEWSRFLGTTPRRATCPARR